LQLHGADILLATWDNSINAPRAVASSLPTTLRESDARRVTSADVARLSGQFVTTDPIRDRPLDVAKKVARKSNWATQTA
jgi:hypothetical protein